MSKWLVKSEPNVYSIDNLKKDKKTLWDGVRNYQARNFLKEMKKGDQIIFYHSATEPIGIAGLATVSSQAIADPSQFDKRSKYFDEKATKDSPRWFSPELKFLEKFNELVPLSKLKKQNELKDMQLLRRGNRLSVMPVTDKEFKSILKLAK
ncbi:MAG: EVE domain-containing protein [Bdellovibrionales bacterium]|nr:EVE domain-containing protein [Bdellovibrionales bacterium]